MQRREDDGRPGGGKRDRPAGYWLDGRWWPLISAAVQFLPPREQVEVMPIRHDGDE